VEVKPGALAELRGAALLVRIGLDHEPWLARPLRVVGDPRLLPGGAADLDVSRGVALLETETPRVRAERGVHVHGFGNPHYWLDPENGRRIARLFRDRFSQLAPADAALFARNYAAWEARLNAAERGWAPQIAAIRGKPVVAWHTSWRYFAEYNGMNIVGFMEPKPGVPPSPSHLAGLIATMRRTGAKVIVMEPYYDRRTADFVAQRTGARVLVLPPSVGGVRTITDYIQLMQNDVGQLAAAVR
jgi:ABC-type Zn uptake system ZnuABC Zn-binding protein ZnuA